MFSANFLRSPFVAWVVPLLLVATIVGITYSPLFALRPAALSLGITVDLLFTIPLVYLLLARQRDLPRWAVGSFFVAGVLVASLILPDQHQHYLRLAKTWLLPVVELTVLVFVVHRARRIARHYRDHSDTSPDFYDALRQATTAVLPPGVAEVLTSELAVLYYGFFARKKHPLQPGEFSYHRKSGSVALLATVMLLTVAEAAVVHLLLTRWSATAAWVLTGISVYTALQVFGVLRSMSRRPIVITDRHLQLRYGFLSETTIPLSAVASVKLTRQPVKYDRLTRSLSPLGELEPHNVWLQLRGEGTLERVYGVRRSFTTLVFHVDDAPRFVEVLRRTLTKKPDLR